MKWDRDELISDDLMVDVAWAVAVQVGSFYKFVRE